MDGFVNIICESYRHFPDYAMARSEFSDDDIRSSYPVVGGWWF
mgnify:CR=1 FL=1